MVCWRFKSNPVAIVQHISEHSVSHDVNAEPQSILEQNGLHATVLLSFSAHAAVCSKESKVIFPTRIIDRLNPRGYLQINLTLPPLSNVQRIEYDGVSLVFFCEHLSLSVFVSPKNPIVWAVIEHHTASQIQEEMRTNQKKSLYPAALSSSICRLEQWTSPTTLQIAYTCLDHERSDTHKLDLRSSADDYAERKRLLEQCASSIAFTCPDPQLTAAIYFAKLRTCEAIFKSHNLGIVHSPGGGMYYSGIWCNDQAEYACPLLAMMTEDVGKPDIIHQACLNSLRGLANYFNRPSLPTPVPHSIEVDGGYIGTLDRGDEAMYAWGTSLVILTMSNASVTQEFFPHVRYCCDLLMNKMGHSPHGIVPSQTDELEGRFPTGAANISTNCLSILAFESAAQVAMLAEMPQLSKTYAEASGKLRQNVHNYFSVAGEHRKYEYYKKCPDARGWTCLTSLARLPDGPAALRFVLHDLWRENVGVPVSESHPSVWDRCTLYAIRAAFMTGLVEEGAQRLSEYVKRRLLMSIAAPFPVENNESYAQLSAESALLVRVVTEGLLGLCVRQGRLISLTPRCPAEWNGYEVRQVHFAGCHLDFTLDAIQNGLRIEVRSEHGTCVKEIEHGQSLTFHIPLAPNPPENVEGCVESDSSKCL